MLSVLKFIVLVGGLLSFIIIHFTVTFIFWLACNTCMAHISPVYFLVRLPLLALVDLLVNDLFLTFFQTTSPASKKWYNLGARNRFFAYCKADFNDKKGELQRFCPVIEQNDRDLTVS